MNDRGIESINLVLQIDNKNGHVIMELSSCFLALLDGFDSLHSHVG